LAPFNQAVYIVEIRAGVTHVTRLRSVLTALVVSTAVPALAQAEDRPLAFGPGEQTTYRVQYLGISAGTAQLTVGSSVDHGGKEIWPLIALAKSDTLLALYPIKDKYVSYYEAASGLTLGSDLYADENRKRRRQKIRIDHDAKKAKVTRQKEGGPEEHVEAEVPGGAMDISAAIYELRNKPLDVGREFELPVFTGTKNFNLRARVEKKMSLNTRLGQKEVFKVKVQTEFSGKFASKRDMFAYFTTDAAHIPVRIEAEFVLGNIVAELTEYKEGRVLAASAVIKNDG
jgi:hypothetical protein